MPQKSPSSIMIESPHTLEIPGIDIASFVLSSGTVSSRRKPQYFDATNPSRCFSLSQAEIYVKQVAHGLQQLGLKPDDKVLLHSSNSLYFPILLWGVVASGCVFTAASPSASATGMFDWDVNGFVTLNKWKLTMTQSWSINFVIPSQNCFSHIPTLRVLP